MQKIFLLILITLFGQSYVMAESAEKTSTEAVKKHKSKKDQHDKKKKHETQDKEDDQNTSDDQNDQNESDEQSKKNMEK